MIEIVIARSNPIEKGLNLSWGLVIRGGHRVLMLFDLSYPASIQGLGNRVRREGTGHVERESLLIALL